MAIIPTGAPDDGTPIIDSQVTPPAEAPVNFDGPAWGDTSGATVELSEQQLRDAAGTLNLPFDTMNAEEREFVAMFARGALESLPPGGDPDNPLIPPAVVDDAEPSAPSDPSAATLEPGAEGAGVGSALDEPGDGGGAQTPPAAAAPVTSPETVGTPGAPTFEIPSPLPPAAPPVPEAPPAQPEPLVMLPNGQMVPLSYAQQLVAQQQQQAPAYPQPAPINPPTAPPFNPNPQPQFPTPFGTEYVDERAGAEIAQLQSTLAQLQANSALEAQRQRAMHEQAIDQAIRETTSGYQNARGLAPEEAEALLGTATQMGALGMYSQMYPGDPRRAVGAALEMAYWITPEMRQREIDRTLETTRAELVETERRKALAGSTTSTPGSVPRTPAPATNRQQADAGIVAMIEADLARQNGGAGPR